MHPELNLLFATHPRPRELTYSSGSASSDSTVMTFKS